MTTLNFGKKTMRGPLLGGASAFPAMRDPIKSEISAQLGEDDGLFLNYGMLKDSLPYTMQDQYDTEPVEQEFETAVLENDFLKATFVLELGGRLWSLYDKKAGRDLLLDNPEFRPNNLAIRNAWFAGGIEYNIGRRGHDAQTCSPRFTAVLADTDGTPVLRFYEFSRDRAIPFQIDFYLPENSHFLFARPRIMNIRDSVIPMYWWSNIAVAQVPGERIVVPAFDTYANQYEGGSHFITRIPLPDGEGFDGTYPDRFPAAKDHFYNIPENSRKYEAVMSPDGYGFLFASTRRLQGRKLFVWGKNQGGKHWQRKLIPPGTPDYIEIQGGLCKTQQECLPMPPRTTWEWLEVYGAVALPPEQVFGEWSDAVRNVTSAVDNILPEAFLVAELERTKHTFACHPGKLIRSGSGWGALEEKRLGHRLTTHLDFGAPGEEQQEWLELLVAGRMSEDPPKSYLVQQEWFELLRDVPFPGWKTLFHLALNYFRQGEYERAELAACASAARKKTPWNQFALSNIYRVTGRNKEAMELLIHLAEKFPEDFSLVKECLKVLIELDAVPEEILRICNQLPEEVLLKPMIKFCHAWGLAHAGCLKEAEEIITRNGGLEIPDIREGENSISELYLYIQKEKAKLNGEIPDEKIDIPFALDLRMKI
jgi:hypothetical protein